MGDGLNNMAHDLKHLKLSKAIENMVVFTVLTRLSLVLMIQQMSDHPPIGSVSRESFLVKF